MAIQTQAPTISDIWQLDLHIVAVVALPGYILRITFGDGQTYDVDKSDLVGRGGLTSELVDPAVFAAVRIGEDGDWLEWPNGFDIGSDTLRWDGELARRGLTRADVGA